MRKTASRLVERTPPVVVYLGFAVLLAFAIAPAFRVLVFGLSLDELLQVRCLGLG
jgi:hypothetical protein